MMRITFKKAIVCALVVFSAVSFAKTESTSTKIGVVKMHEVAEKSKQYQAMRDKMQKDFAPREKEINTQEKNLKDKSDKFQKDSAILSEAERTKQEKELVALQRDLQRAKSEFREDAAARQQEEMQKFNTKLQEVMQAVGKEGQYDFILPNEVLPYSAQDHDITDKVIAKLDSMK